MNRLLLGIAIGALLQLAVDNHYVLFMPDRLVPKEVFEELEPSEPDEPEVDEVWVDVPMRRLA